MFLLHKLTNFCALSLPLLADGITSFTTSDKTFGGATTLMANGFWAFMLLVFIVCCLTGAGAIIYGINQGQMPIMTIIISACGVVLPGLLFIIARMAGLAPALELFTMVVPVPPLELLC